MYYCWCCCCSTHRWLPVTDAESNSFSKTRGVGIHFCNGKHVSMVKFLLAFPLFCSLLTISLRNPRTTHKHTHTTRHIEGGHRLSMEFSSFSLCCCSRNVFIHNQLSWLRGSRSVRLGLEIASAYRLNGYHTQPKTLQRLLTFVSHEENYEVLPKKLVFLIFLEFPPLTKKR